MLQYTPVLLCTLLLSSLSLIQAMNLHTIASKVPSANTKYPNLLLVMVHGLDSSSNTWVETMKTLEQDVACLAVDQRGCGYTPFGKLEDFSQDTLVADLHQTIEEQLSKDQNIVLLGHSLGGRVAMGYGATHPERLAACLIEDMDIAPRVPTKNGFVVLKDYEGLFDRYAASKEEMMQRFLDAGYPQSFLDKALSQGRIDAAKDDNPLLESGPAEGSWWSHCNPDFRKYCYPQVLSTKQGGLDCDTISKGNIPCHILVAGQETGTVCIEEAVQEMHKRLGCEPKSTIHRFPTAGHSIHSTAPEEFIATVRQILQSVAK